MKKLKVMFLENNKLQVVGRSYKQDSKFGLPLHLYYFTTSIILYICSVTTMCAMFTLFLFLFTFAKIELQSICICIIIISKLFFRSFSLEWRTGWRWSSLDWRSGWRWSATVATRIQQYQWSGDCTSYTSWTAELLEGSSGTTALRGKT